MTDIAAPQGGSPGLSIAMQYPRLGLRRWHWHWSTPARVRVGALAAVVLAVAAAALTASLFGQLHGEFGAVGQRDESEAIATTSLYFYLTDMDGSGADVLLVGSDAALTVAAGLPAASCACWLSNCASAISASYWPSRAATALSCCSAAALPASATTAWSRYLLAFARSLA